MAQELTKGSGLVYLFDLSSKALKKPFCNSLSNVTVVLKGKMKELMQGVDRKRFGRGMAQQARSSVRAEPGSPSDGVDGELENEAGEFLAAAFGEWKKP